VAAEGRSPRASTARTVAQRCLQGAPAGPKYGQVQVAINLIPRSLIRTLYFSVPRTLATTSPAEEAVIATRPLAKYDWPRERTASLNSRATFWVIPIIPSHPGRLRNPTSGGRPPKSLLLRGLDLDDEVGPQRARAQASQSSTARRSCLPNPRTPIRTGPRRSLPGAVPLSGESGVDLRPQTPH
jgi:hypothetical protein